MARGPTYKVPRRRRREGRTDYYRRYRMVKSGQRVRVVVRKTNAQVIVQLIRFSPSGDVTLVGVNSKALRKYGWLGDLNNTPASYLTGLLAGMLAVRRGIKYVVPDIGLHKAVKEARVFAAIKGLLDAGVEVPVAKEVLPSDERIEGAHIAEYARQLSGQGEELFRARFREYLSRGLDPRNLPQHFKEVSVKMKEVLTSGESS
ncbi:MAG: 50S ribosomal protein L18 [Zestosphaera sp.]